MYRNLSATHSSRNPNRNFHIIYLTVAVIAITGCSAIPSSSNKQWSEFTGKVDAHGALPVMHHEFNILPFVEMLEDSDNGNSTCFQKKPNGEVDPISYQCATKKFYARTRQLSEPYQRMERNRIQERILAVSEDRCNAYKRYLRYDQSMSDFWLGFGSTLAGGLGALSGTLPAAKTFAAFGGVLSGIKAEYNQDFYGNLFYSVITKAIDEQRKDAYRQIQTYGQSKSLTQYPVEAAIKDAILYDGTCSAVSAMEFAENAVQLVNDPGMDGMMRFLLKANQSRYILQNGIKDISELKQAGITTTFENSRYGNQIGSKDDEHNPQSNIQMQLNIANQQTAENIVEAVAQMYAGNNTTKRSKWQNMSDEDKKGLSRKIATQLTEIISAFKENILLCAKPATELYSEYLTNEAALQHESGIKITEAQIKRDQASNKVEKINIEINGIGQHFQALIDSLTKAGVASVPDDNQANSAQFSWQYNQQSVRFTPTETCPKP